MKGVGAPASSRTPLRVDQDYVSTETIIAAFLVSTVGFSLFLYGKKQRRLPQLVTGILMMTSPLVLGDPVWMIVAAVAMVLGLRVAVCHGI